MKSLKNVLKHPSLSELAWIIIGQVSSLALGFISIKLLSTMGTEEFGRYALVLTLAALLSAFLYGPADQGFIRHYYDYLNLGLSKTYIRVFFRFLKNAGLLTFVLFIPLVFVVYFLGAEKISAGIIIGVYLILSSVSNSFTSMLNTIRQRKMNAIVLILERSIIVVLLYLAVRSGNLTSIEAIVIILFSLVVVVCLKGFLLRKRVPEDDTVQSTESFKSNQKEIHKKVIKFSIPFAIWGVMGWLQSNSDRWIIEHYLTTSDVGVFAIMLALTAYMIATPSGAIGQFFQPIIYQKHASNNNIKKLITYFIISIIGIGLFATAVSFFFGEKIILLVSNHNFTTYWHILPLLCIGIGFFQVAQALTIHGAIKKTPQIYIMPKIVSGVFAVLSNIFFISKMGIPGAAISICITNILYLSLVAFVNKRHCHKSLYIKS